MEQTLYRAILYTNKTRKSGGVTISPFFRNCRKQPIQERRRRRIPKYSISHSPNSRSKTGEKKKCQAAIAAIKPRDAPSTRRHFFWKKRGEKIIFHISSDRESEVSTHTSPLQLADPFFWGKIPEFGPSFHFLEDDLDIRTRSD